MKKKKLLSLVASSALVISSLGITAPAVLADDSIVYGDANNDGDITAEDAQLISQYLLKKVSKEDINLANADANKDGKVDLADSSAILKYVRGYDIKDMPSVDDESYHSPEIKNAKVIAGSILNINQELFERNDWNKYEIPVFLSEYDNSEINNLNLSIKVPSECYVTGVKVNGYSGEYMMDTDGIVTENFDPYSRSGDVNINIYGSGNLVTNYADHLQNDSRTGYHILTLEVIVRGDAHISASGFNDGNYITAYTPDGLNEVYYGGKDFDLELYYGNEYGTKWTFEPSYTANAFIGCQWVSSDEPRFTNYFKMNSPRVMIGTVGETKMLDYNNEYNGKKYGVHCSTWGSYGYNAITSTEDYGITFIQPGVTEETFNFGPSSYRSVGKNYTFVAITKENESDPDPIEIIESDFRTGLRAYFTNSEGKEITSLVAGEKVKLNICVDNTLGYTGWETPEGMSFNIGQYKYQPFEKITVDEKPSDYRVGTAGGYRVSAVCDGLYDTWESLAKTNGAILSYDVTVSDKTGEYILDFSALGRFKNTNKMRTIYVPELKYTVYASADEIPEKELKTAHLNAGLCAEWMSFNAKHSGDKASLRVYTDKFHYTGIDSPSEISFDIDIYSKNGGKGEITVDSLKNVDAEFTYKTKVTEPGHVKLSVSCKDEKLSDTWNKCLLAQSSTTGNRSLFTINCICPEVNAEELYTCEISNVKAVTADGRSAESVSTMSNLLTVNKAEEVTSTSTTTTGTTKTTTTTTTTATGTTTAGEDIKWGDLNDNGLVNISDAVLLMQSLANPSDYKLSEDQLRNADVVNDGGVTASDALAIQMVDMQMIELSELPLTYEQFISKIS